VKLKESGEKTFAHNSFSVKDRLKMLGFRLNNEERAMERSTRVGAQAVRGVRFEDTEGTFVLLRSGRRDIGPAAISCQERASPDNESIRVKTKSWKQEGPSGMGPTVK